MEANAQTPTSRCVTTILYYFTRESCRATMTMARVQQDMGPSMSHPDGANQLAKLPFLIHYRC